MAGKRRGLQAAAALGALALSLTACGGGGSSKSSDNGAPKKGGTLKIIGAGDVDHLDTAGGYTTVANSLERAWARQLFSYPGSDDVKTSITLQPDLAAELPTTANGGISADGKTYTIKLKTGVQWNTSPARDVVAGDEVRGIKRLCNPNPNATSGGLAYFTSTIVGMKEYCDGYAKVGKDDAAAQAAYQNGHEISGLSAPDDHTVVFKLLQAAGDFPSILGQGFASPAPKEYDAYVPDSDTFRQHTISDGPYAITKYTATKEIMLDRNPVWKAETDPLRKAYVDHIDVIQGQASPDAAEQQIEAGTADLLWDHAVPSTTIAQMKASKDPRLGIYPGPNTNPHLRFNIESPNNKGALKNLHIRQAIEYAINKDAIAKIYGGRSVNQVLTTVIPPGSVGYQASNLYPTPNDQGDAAKCKALLAQGMKEVGITSLSLIYPYRNSSNHPKVTQSVASNLKDCGINTTLQSTTPDDFYGKYIGLVAKSKQGKWDIAAPGWSADWPGNNGRAIVYPLFDSAACGDGTANYGCYSSPTTDGLIQKALAATTTDEAATYWAQADQQIMKDAAFVPFQQQLTPLTRSTRVHNAQFYMTAQLYDYTNIWLS
ncbi:MAG: transporter substrate-binding protein, partial [Actinomycetia bacterium]|nr:transporter substrate-binding protein [Actinomycetes bacterium]